MQGTRRRRSIYSDLDQGYFFYLVTLETTGAVCPNSMSFLKGFVN